MVRRFFIPDSDRPFRLVYGRQQGLDPNPRPGNLFSDHCQRCHLYSDLAVVAGEQSGGCSHVRNPAPGGLSGIGTQRAGHILPQYRVRHIGANTTSVFLSAVPGVAALVAIPILQEMPGLPAWIGMITVTVGILLALGIVGIHKPVMTANDQER